MTPKALQSQIVLGEDSKHQFKVDVRNAESLAAEMAAFANSEGGTIFDNRIEIISPGHLPNNLTVEKIRAGNSNIRNPILVSYVAKGLLPYHGLGSGIKRALEQWPQIEFADDHDGCLFTVTVTRKPVETLDLVDENAPKREDASINAPRNPLQQRILGFIGSNPAISYDDLAHLTQKDRTTVMRAIAKLKAQGRLKRIGPRKGGHWEVIDGGTIN